VDLSAFADSLTAWLRGDESPQAYAGAQDVAEILDMWRRVLKSKFEKKR
jgi:hypothetical protein